MKEIRDWALFLVIILGIVFAISHWRAPATPRHTAEYMTLQEETALQHARQMDAAREKLYTGFVYFVLGMFAVVVVGAFAGVIYALAKANTAYLQRHVMAIHADDNGLYPIIKVQQGGIHHLIDPNKLALPASHLSNDGFTYSIPLDGHPALQNHQVATASNAQGIQLAVIGRRAGGSLHGYDPLMDASVQPDQSNITVLPAEQPAEDILTRYSVAPAPDDMDPLA